MIFLFVPPLQCSFNFFMGFLEHLYENNCVGEKVITSCNRQSIVIVQCYETLSETIESLGEELSKTTATFLKYSL